MFVAPVGGILVGFFMWNEVVPQFGKCINSCDDYNMYVRVGSCCVVLALALGWAMTDTSPSPPLLLQSMT